MLNHRAMNGLFSAYLVKDDSPSQLNPKEVLPIH